jgi:acetoin utilization protein AcuB
MAKTSVADLMTTRVRTSEPSCRARRLWAMLAEEGCHHIPIVDGGCVVGMVSTRDLVRLADERGATRDSSESYDEATAADIMSTDVESVCVSDSVETVIGRIGRGDIHALVVLDDDDELVGIVTNRDLLQYLLSG